MKQPLETSALRQPLSDYVKELFDVLSVNQTYIYKTARMSPHTYYRVLRGNEPPGSRDRFLIACLVLIRQSYDDRIINKEEQRDLIRKLRRVGGDTVIVAAKYGLQELTDYLQQAYQRSRNRFKSNN